MDHVEYFCDSLIILVKGKPVLQGKLQDIKNSYKRKNIRVIAKQYEVTEDVIFKIRSKKIRR